ncbi:MAG: DUF4139 domain-containing protein [Thermodesulfobacteriota bacterium]|jgi:hypothetical protein|nr:DUF4139 domain-containing protein [Thermodesulfobacteriota bacterium]
MRKTFLFIFCGMIAAVGLCLDPAPIAAETATTLEDQTAVAVTVYNEDLALVRDRRRVELPKGEIRLAVREVSARIRPETALLRTPDGKSPLRVIEQNFDFDLLTPDKLLEQYIGREVLLVRTHPTSGAEQTQPATILAYNDGVPILKVGDQIETGVPGRLVFPDVPETLRDRPTLVLLLDNPRAGQRELELSYLSGGLSWRADYVARLNESDDRLDLSGWVTLTNRSGIAFRNARVQLVAGDVQQARDKMRAAEAQPRMAMALQDAAPQEEGLFEYHLYSLARPTSIRDNQTKQVSLLSAAGLPVRKELVLRGASHFYTGRYGEPQRGLKVAVFVAFDNREQDGLGVALPKGIMRVYKDDSRGTAQFIGEDRIDHTPKNEEVRLRLGSSFDLTAEKVQTDYHKLDQGRDKLPVIETAWRITLKNAKPQAETVRVEEPLPGDWSILEENFPHRKLSSALAGWDIEVPAEGEAVLEYRARIRY